MKFHKLVLTCALILRWNAQAENYDPLSSIPEDGRLNFTGLAMKYGQRVEEHDLITGDGYIIKLHHIFGDTKRPVLLIHGAIISSDCFVLRGETSLAIILARKGYDVWAFNIRGNVYSRRHVILDADEHKEFWDFSLHEIAYYDIPLAIDFVLLVTGQKKLQAIGYSKGTALVYIMGAIKPEYNEKISIFVSLAPVSHLQNTKPYMSAVIEFSPSIIAALISTGQVEFGGYTSAFKRVWNDVCTVKGTGYQICLLEGLYQLTGEDVDEIEEEFFHTIVGHFPDGASTKSMYHLAQFGKRKVIGQYDYGLEKNQIIYGSSTPPKYDLKKVTMKIALFVAQNDRIATIEDVALLRKELPNIVQYHVIKRPQFNHLDFVWGRTTYKTLYPHILDTLLRYR